MNEKYLLLIKKAIEMTKLSYSPYSNFNVGAALLCSDGTIFGGCNIENSAFGPSVCAERTAIFKAVSENNRDFSAIAIVGGHKKDGMAEITDYCPPCGVCRQVMREFCDNDFKIILSKTSNPTLESFSNGEVEVYTLKQLLPLSFSL